MTYTLSTLPNHLRVATETLPGMESVTVAVTVDVGARFEKENEGGLSHLLEHMAFKGTKRRTALAIAQEMDMVGGGMNAYTSLENTVYYVRVLKEDLPLAVDMLADILQHSTFDAEELARERQVILQEIAMHFDTPDDLVFDYFSETAYPSQALGRSILGTPELVSSYKKADLSRYMDTHYHAPSMVVSAAGNVEHQSFLALVQEHFNALGSNICPPAEHGHYQGGDKRVESDLEQLHLTLGFESVSVHHTDYYVWQVLATLLGGGMSSRLFQEVREKRGLAYTVQSFVSSYADSGVLAIYAATDKVSEMLPVVCDEISKLQKAVTAAELTRAKNQIKASLLMSRESSPAIAEWIGRHLLTYNRYRHAAKIVRLIEAVTVEDVTRIGTELAAKKNLTLAALGPQKGLPEYDKIQAALG